MEKIFIHFLFDYDAVLKISQGEDLLISLSTTESLSDEIEIEIYNPTSFDISVHPITKKQDKKLFSYTAHVKLHNEKLVSENEYIKIYELPEKHYIIKYMPLTISSQEIQGDKIEINDSEIKKLSFVNDMAGRAKIEVLKIDSKKISKEEEYFVYTNDDFEEENIPDLVLLSFFEAYAAKDYNVCMSYLSDSFKTNLSSNDLKTFFGSFSSCRLINYYTQPSIALFYEDNALIFSADIIQNKISDIYEVN